MYDKKFIENILSRKDLFVPLIFTEKQVDILRKREKGIRLGNAERKQLYTSIKAKLAALHSMAWKKKYYVTAKNPIPERVERAQIILDDLDRAFVSGSFLFSERYNDIDVFIFGRRKGEKKIGKLHLVYLPEKALLDPVIQSAARSSVSNFVASREYSKPKLSLFDYMQLFQESALQVIRGKEGKEDLRDIIFYRSCSEDVLLSSEKLIEKVDDVMGLGRKEKLDYMKKAFISIIKNFNKTYVRRELKDYLGVLDEDIKEFSINKHLRYYKETYMEAIA